MARPLNRMWRLSHAVQGGPSDEEIAWHEEPAAELTDGDVLVESTHVVIDSIVTGMPAAEGAPLPCAAIGKVIESRDPRVPVGSTVSGLFGAQTHPRVPGNTVFVHPDNALTDEDYLGAVSYIGATALLAVQEVVKPQHGETVVVTAASSTVGALAGQLAKREGARVVGVTTSAAHSSWLIGELGFDAAIDRRSEDLGPALSRLCPEGIDCVIDGLGGTVLDACLAQLAMHARLALYGTAQQARPAAPVHFGQLVAKRARLHGLSFLDYPLELAGTLETLTDLVTSKRLRYRLEQLEGLEHTAAALRRSRGEAETIVLRIAS